MKRFPACSPTITPAQPRASADSTNFPLRWCRRVRLWSNVLPKPMPGFHPDLADSVSQRQRGSLKHKAEHLGYDVVVVRRRLHQSGVPCNCRASPPIRQGPLGRHRRRRSEPTSASLTNVAPAANGSHCHLGFDRVDGDPHRLGQPLNNRHNPGQLFPAETGTAPGLLDSPPTSTMSAPASAIAKPCATAALVVS